jgi:hypothetical protein
VWFFVRLNVVVFGLWILWGGEVPVNPYCRIVGVVGNIRNREFRLDLGGHGARDVRRRAGDVLNGVTSARASSPPGP